METGKTTKYFKYAIGEIILVVIGILIALSINNWNEKNKAKEKETHALNEIISDLENNIETLTDI
jgi:sensor domain CHASE-containing protein